LLAAALTSCHPSPGPPVDITVPDGATLGQVADTLVARGVIGSRRVFIAYARLRGDDRRIKAGRYRLARSSRWRDVLSDLTAGHVVTVTLTVPEGFRLTRIAPRIAALTGLTRDSVLRAMSAPGVAERYHVPGPGLEGYLFPDTYRFAPGVDISRVLTTLTERYRSEWTPMRRDRLDSLGMSEREAVTLASIIQAEARRVREMPLISAVYHNRLRRGYLLQADPTVLYALGGPRARLLYAAIDSVADSPYNTYTRPGLPPGPICAPGDAAIEAALFPADVDYLYFVAWSDGSHVFTRSLAEHNRAKARARRARARAARGERDDPIEDAEAPGRP